MNRKQLICELEKRMSKQYTEDFMSIYLSIGLTAEQGWERYKTIVFGLMAGEIN